VQYPQQGNAPHMQQQPYQQRAGPSGMFSQSGAVPQYGSEGSLVGGGGVSGVYTDSLDGNA
jgi:uncharacterized protein GlcG (DUF336 family)